MVDGGTGVAQPLLAWAGCLRKRRTMVVRDSLCCN